MINNVTLVGRLGHDVELRFLPTGKPVTRLRIATDASYTNSDGQRVEQTDWHSVVVFGRNAENCRQYLGKGSLVYIEGSLKNRRWVDQEGQKHYRTDIVADEVMFVDSRSDSSAASDSFGSAPTPSFSSPSGSAPKFEEIKTDDDLPF